MTHSRSRIVTLSTAAAALLLTAIPARAQVPEGSPTDLPLLSDETRRGMGSVIAVETRTPVGKTIDGNIGDWVGEPSRYGGTAVVSAGEYVYQDHLFDAYGADDGRDAERLAVTDGLEAANPGLYRLDALAQADAPGQLGLSAPERFAYDESYGDAVDRQDRADLHEVRIAAGADRMSLLARTTTMTSPSDTALLLLADTTDGSASYDIPFNAGLTTSVADVAAFIADGRVLVADLTSGTVVEEGTAKANADGYVNAIEASVALDRVIGGDGDLKIAVASGRPNDTGDGFSDLELEVVDEVADANVANVAFRFGEPVRYWFDKDQALSLHGGTIDPFLTTIDIDALSAGTSQRYVPGPGYHDRIFVSPESTGVPKEGGVNGVMQHYGVYLPSTYEGEPVPLQWWLHWRGGDAHSGAAIVPKVFKQFGEDKGAIVVAPSGRGTSTWYVGRGHVDFRQVWNDVFDTFAIDDSRVYVSGHSMGGWGSYLLTLLYPDRFAAAAPVAGPVTQGAWTGLDFSGCDEFTFEDYSPCYISANGSDPRAQHTRKLLENARHVPYAILHGTDDELVPYSGVARQAERLVALGYRHRFYTYPGYEHYSHPVADQWSEAASYLHSFSRPTSPARVSFKRDMAFERATETVQSDGATLNFDFDSAYWMSGLTAANLESGTASFEGRSLAISEIPYLAVPDTGPPTAPGQTGPYVITGLQWIDDPAGTVTAPTNAFEIALDGATAVTLDAAQMRLETDRTISGQVSTQQSLDLGVSGAWAALPEVTVDGAPATARLSDGVLRFLVPPGDHEIEVVPPRETSVAFTEASARGAQYSDRATFKATLVSGDDALGGQTLTFTLGRSTEQAVTGEDGVATVSLAVSEAPGDQEVSVSFAGVHRRLLASRASQPFSVTREDSATALSVLGRVPDTRVVARLSDADSNDPIGERTVVFYADGERIGSALTSDTGVASLAVRDARHRRPGTTYRATFAGDAFFILSSATARR